MNKGDFDKKNIILKDFDVLKGKRVNNGVLAKLVQALQILV